MGLAGKGMTKWQAHCPKDKPDSISIMFQITEPPLELWIINYDRPQEGK